MVLINEVQLLFQRLSDLNQPLVPGMAEVGSMSSNHYQNQRFVRALLYNAARATSRVREVRVLREHL